MSLLHNFERVLVENCQALIQPNAAVVDSVQRNRSQRASAFLLTVAGGSTIATLAYLIVAGQITATLSPAQWGLLIIPGGTFFEYWLARQGRHNLAGMIFVLLATPAIIGSVLSAPHLFSPLNGLYFTSSTVLFARLVYGWKIGALALLYNSAAMVSAYWFVEGLRLDEILLGPVFFQLTLFLVLIAILFVERRAPANRCEDDPQPVATDESLVRNAHITASSQAVQNEAGDSTFAQERQQLLEQIQLQHEAISLLRQKLDTQYQILDQLPLGVFAKDAQGKHLLINRGGAQRIGREPREIIGLRDDQLSSVEVARIYRAEDDQLLSGLKTTVRSETNVPARDGTSRLLRSQKWPLRDESGQITGVIGVSEDITEERQQQNALAISQNQIALLFENSPLAIIEWNLDGDITNWNPAAEKMFGVERQAAIGRPLSELVLTPEARDHAERLRTLFRRERALVALGGASSTVLRSHHKGQDGRVIARDWTFTILTQTQDVVVGFGAIVADVTAQVRAQQQLESALNRLGMFIEQVPVAIIEWDAQRIIQGWNAAAQTIFGWSPEEALGKEALDLMVPQSQREHIADVFTRMINGSAPVYSENENVTRDGRTILCQWINIPLIDDLGQRVGLISVAQDVTESRRNQQQALTLVATQARMATLKQFVQRVSHYFRNHLAQIEINRHLMQRMASKAEDVRFSERLSLLHNGIRRMAEQLDNLAMISSIVVIEESLIDVSTVAQEAFNSLRRDAEARSLNYTFIAGSDTIAVMADERALRDAFKRLLQNAVNYTREGGSVTMQVRREGSDAVIEILDTGIGMSEEQVARAFELFYRADEASSLESGGLGLGLNVARMVVENHKGSIDVESQLGKGSLFSVRLPLASE